MAGVAAGGFLARAFESMLKECGNKKYSALQTAIQAYFDNWKDQHLISAVKNGSEESDSGTEKVKTGDNHLNGDTSSADDASINRTEPDKVLDNAGQTLGEELVELVLNPLRLAFETKNIKVVELALDCLHKLIEYNTLEGDPGLDGGPNSKLLTEILSMVCSLVGNSTPDSTTLQVLKVLLTVIASTKVRVHGDPLLGVIRVCFDVALNSKSPINKATSKVMLTQMLTIVLRHLETDGVSSDSVETREADSKNVSLVASENLVYVKQINISFLASVEGIQNLIGANDIKGLEVIIKNTVSLEDKRKSSSEMDPQITNVKLHDALLVFRSLCEMGVKEGNDELTTKTRILVLELLQGSLEDVASQKIFQFLGSVRAHLLLILIRASVSASAILFQCAIGILSVLLLRLRESFKDEIGILFSVIVLRSLDGTDLNQKVIVLRMLERVCKDPQLLVDIYVNFDCDPDSQKLFEKMVIALSKICQGTQNMDTKSSAASLSRTVKVSSLQILVTVLKSLEIWEKSHRGLENKNAAESFGEVSPGKLNEPKNGKDLRNFDKLGDDDSITNNAISEFNRNSVKGIQYLISSQLVDNNPFSVSQFLVNTPHLDKAMIGDYLSQNEKFATGVTHAYVESMKFSGMKLHNAIYELLKGFQLPQDAQKIDRIMEKFSECYYMKNPNLFKNADDVYVIAYAILMLTADCKDSKKISKSDFIRLSSRNGEPAPKEILEEIYDAIVKQKIHFAVDPAWTSNDSERVQMNQILKTLNLSLPKSKSLYGSKLEIEELIKQIQNIMKAQDRKMGIFYTSERVELMYPMVEVVGWPLLATFSVTMGDAENDPRINLCMEGFKEGVNLTHALEIDTVRYAFMTSLLRYNFLHAPKDMREKNVEALCALLDLCDTGIYALQESWFAIIECISRLEYVVSWPPITATVMQGSNQIARDSVVQTLRRLAGGPTDQVFVNSIKLPSDAAVEFFTALCSVSAEELKQTPACTFCLQKIVEISYDNMARIHLVWSRIWTVVSLHFIFSGEHADERVAMYAIDSLRQLTIKYLDRIELPNFSFQNDILNPIAILMQRSKSETLTRLLLNSIIQIIKSRVGRLKSGWRSIFMIFSAAAENDMEPIVERAFENLEQVMLEHFNQVFKDFFMDFVNCLIGFAKNKCSQSISLKAIALLRICEDRLAEGLISNGSPKLADSSTDDACCAAEKYWYAMLNGLSYLTSDPRSEVRNCALEVLFDLLNERGLKFSYSFWETIFHLVLFPIFNNIVKSGKESSTSFGDDFARESSVHALQLLCNLFSSFYKEVSFMLPKLLSLLLDCAKKNDQLVVSVSFGALVHLIEVGGYQFNDPDWDTLLKSIMDAAYTTQPLELLNDLGFENGKYLPRNSMSASVDVYQVDHNQEALSRAATDRNEGIITSSPGTPTNTAKLESLQSNQSFGKRIMGNMKDNIFMRSFTSKDQVLQPDELISSPSIKIDDAALDHVTRDEEDGPGLDTVRSKCITQLLLLGAVDCIQKKYWNKLNAQHKIALMEILYSVLEFAASYNSYSNLKVRMHQIPTLRPPSNLFRQELSGTCIYLDILQKATTAVNEEKVVNEKLEGVAEEKLVSFCEHILRDASDFQTSMEETTNMEIHRVSELRSPITVKVLKSMSKMNPNIFKNHINQFYPSITKLIRSDQIAVRDALADLLSTQFTALLP